MEEKKKEAVNEVKDEQKKEKTKEEVNQKTICNIKENYKRREQEIVKQLSYEVPHGTTIGTHREIVWAKMFEEIVPRKFVMEQSVFIIDASGSVSKEVDLAIFDETYTPYIFKYGHMKFIPIEAVAVVIECKSKNMDRKRLGDWAKSIKELETYKKSFARMVRNIACGEENEGNTQKATRPLRILCCLNEEYEDTLKEDGEDIFDIVIRANTDDNKLTIQWKKEKESLYYWYKELNLVKCKDSSEGDNKKVKKCKLTNYVVKQNDIELSLMSFNFQLNQVLMLINNPMLFPHLSYAEMFDEKKYGGQGK